MSDHSNADQNPYQPPESPEPPREEPPTSAFDAVGRRFMRLLGERGSVLTGVWAMIALFNLGTVALSAAIQYKTGAGVFTFDMLQDPAAMNQYANQQQFSLLSLLIYPLMWVSGALYFAGFAPMRTVEVEDRANFSFADARREMFSNFGSTMGVVFLYGLVAGVGMMCCVLPGLVAAFVLLAAPYMVAARGWGVFDSFSKAIEWLKRHWLLLGAAGGAMLLLSIFVSVVSFVSISAMTGAFGEVGILLANASVWLLGSIVGYFGWLFAGAVFITIDLAEERYFGLG